MSLQENLEQIRRQKDQEEAARQEQIRLAEAEAAAKEKAAQEAEARAKEAAEAERLAAVRSQISQLSGQKEKLEGLLGEIESVYASTKEAGQDLVKMHRGLEQLIVKHADILAERGISGVRDILKSEEYAQEDEVVGLKQARAGVIAPREAIKDKARLETGNESLTGNLSKKGAIELVSKRLVDVTAEIEELEAGTPEGQEKKRAAVKEEILEDRPRANYRLIGNVTNERFIISRDIEMAKAHGADFVRGAILEFYKGKVDGEVEQNIERGDFGVLNAVESIKAWPEQFMPALQAIKKLEQSTSAAEQQVFDFLEGNKTAFEKLQADRDYRDLHPFGAARKFVGSWLARASDYSRSPKYEWLMAWLKNMHDIEERIKKGEFEEFIIEKEKLPLPETVITLAEEYQAYLGKLLNYIESEKALPGSNLRDLSVKKEMQYVAIRSVSGRSARSYPPTVFSRHDLEVQQKQVTGLKADGERTKAELERKVAADWAEADLWHFNGEHRDVEQLARQQKEITEWQEDNKDKATEALAQARPDFKDRTEEKIHLYKNDRDQRCTMSASDLIREGQADAAKEKVEEAEITRLDGEIMVKEASPPKLFGKEKHAQELAALKADKEQHKAALATLKKDARARQAKTEELSALVEILNIQRLGRDLPSEEMTIGALLQAIDQAIETKSQEKLPEEDEVLVAEFRRLEKSEREAKEKFRPGR